MSKRTVSSQITNFKTYSMYLRQFLTLAENVFEYNDLPQFIDVSFFNRNLLRKGSIAFFKDEILGVIALPYTIIGTLDVYGRPTAIQVYGQNGYSRMLKQGEFVIMYDSNGRYPLYLDIIQYAERMAQATRVIDINLEQQKTPRFIKTTQEREASVKRIFEDVDKGVDKILTYSDIDLDDTTMCLAPSPYVSDKVQEEKEKIWSEFLRLIGVSNLSTQKKERNITDEISAMQGGTVASRYARFEPRKRAIDEINKKFGTNITVRYYDGEPSTDVEDEDYYDNIGGVM